MPAGQRAPDGPFMPGAQRGAVERVFDKTLTDAVFGQVVRELFDVRPGGGAGLPSAFDEKAGGGDARRPPVQGEFDPFALRRAVGILRPLLRIEGQQHLLESVAIVVSNQIELQIPAVLSIKSIFFIIPDEKSPHNGKSEKKTLPETQKKLGFFWETRV